MNATGKDVDTAGGQRPSPGDAEQPLANASADAPARHLHRDRDFGIGYGNSSGYGYKDHFLDGHVDALFRFR